MFKRLLPAHIDNTYHGYKLALWLFAALVFMKSVVSLSSIFDGYDVAVSADGMPLDAYTPACARAVLSMSAAWGLAQLMICLLCAVTLIRYRAMVPFMFALLLLEHLSRRLIFMVMPLESSGTPPGFYVNLVLLALLAVGFVLSLMSRGSRQANE